MDNEEFIEQYKNDTNKMDLMTLVYDELVEYCREHNIDEETVSTEQLEDIAQQMIREEEF